MPNLKKAIKILCAIIYVAVFILFAVIAIGDSVIFVKGNIAIHDLQNSSKIDDPILKHLLEDESDTLEFDYGNNVKGDDGIYEVYCKFSIKNNMKINVVSTKIGGVWYVKYIFVNGNKSDGNLSDFVSLK